MMKSAANLSIENYSLLITNPVYLVFTADGPKGETPSELFKCYQGGE